MMKHAVPGAKVLGGGAILPALTLAAPKVTTSSIHPQSNSVLPGPNSNISSLNKTYCIQRHPNNTKLPSSSSFTSVTPIQPKPAPLPTPQTILTSAVVQPGTLRKAKRVVGIRSLGAYTVTIKDGQLIIQGPDHAAAINIARLLSTGTTKLAYLDGKQVLLSRCSV